MQTLKKSNFNEKIFLEVDLTIFFDNVSVIFDHKFKVGLLFELLHGGHIKYIVVDRVLTPRRPLIYRIVEFRTW